jgi:hypothetical protein
MVYTRAYVQQQQTQAHMTATHVTTRPPGLSSPAGQQVAPLTIAVHPPRPQQPDYHQSAPVRHPESMTDESPDKLDSTENLASQTRNPVHCRTPNSAPRSGEDTPSGVDLEPSKSHIPAECIRSSALPHRSKTTKLFILPRA